MRLVAPAKINLHLRVGPARSDGFHPLLSWMTTVSLFDTLTFRSTQTSGISLGCDDPKIPTDDSNLVMKAAKLLMSRLPSQRQDAIGGLEIDLQKRIPSGAGLGGGSSDAAATVIALTRLWRMSWTPSELTRVAAELGSDVRFFLGGSSSICTSRGEIVVPITKPQVKWALLVLPPIHLSTPAVYQRFDERNQSRAGWDDQPDWHQWAQLSARLLLPRLVNDLEPPAFSLAPELDALRRRIEAIVDQPVRMSGSGSSLFTLFDGSEEAESAAHRIAKECDVVTRAAEISPQIKEDDN